MASGAMTMVWGTELATMFPEVAGLCQTETPRFEVRHQYRASKTDSSEVSCYSVRPDVNELRSLRGQKTVYVHASFAVFEAIEV